MMKYLAPCRVIVLAVLIAACGCTSPGFSFDVLADMRKFTPPEYPGTEHFMGVAEAIRANGPGAFMLCIGDLDPPDRVRAALDTALGKDYLLYPVVGNHEIEEPENMVWLREYNRGGNTLPHIVRPGPPGGVETSYSFDYRNVHVAVINQYYDGTADDVGPGIVGDALYAWLEEDLAANTKPIVFVAGHEPYLPIADIDNGNVRHRGDSLDADPKANHRFWTLLRKYGVTAYFCGHTHCVSLAKINGVWQIDPGHARGIGDKGASSSFLRIRVQGERVDCDVYRSIEPERRTYTFRYTERIR